MKMSSLFNLRTYRKLKLFTLCLGVVMFFALLPRELLPHFPVHEKVQHVLAFACLTLFASLKRKLAFTYICLFILLLGGVVELVQPLIGRSAELSDFFANCIGVLLVYVPVFLFKCIFEKPRRDW